MAGHVHTRRFSAEESDYDRGCCHDDERRRNGGRKMAKQEHGGE